MKPLTRDEVLKLKAATLYIINKCGVVDYYHLFKILYFADREHYATYGRRIVQDTFVAMANGPVPSSLYDAVKAKIGRGGLPANSDLWEIVNAIGQEAGEAEYYLYTLEKPDMDELSVSDVEMLDKAIDKCVGLRFSELRDLSHDEAWKAAGRNGAIEPHNSARAGGATDAMMSFIEELETFDTVLA